MTTIFETIQREYDYDVASPAILSSRHQVPFSYDSINKTWLTDALCRNIPGAKVVEFALGDDDDWTSNRRRIFLRYNREGHQAGLPTSVFCKAAQSLTHRFHLGVSGGAYSEYIFFEKARDRLSLDTPRAFNATFDSRSYAYIVVLEDIGNDVTFCEHTTPVSRHAAERQVDLLAELHATFFDKPDLNSATLQLPTWPEFWAAVCRNGFEEYSNQGFLDAKAVIPGRLYDRFSEIWPATMRSVALHKGRPATLMHGDTHFRQWYLRADDTMGVTDWQGCSFGDGIRDLAYAMSTSLAVEDRRAWEKDLVSRYLDQTKRLGGERLSFDDAWTRYRQQLLSALSYWTITFRHPETMPVMQPEDATLEFIRRITHAIDDLDALDAF